MIQSSTMKKLCAVSPILLCLAMPVLASDHTPPSVQPATTFAAVEAHNDEKVAIAVEPYDTKEKEAIFRVDYLSHGVMPVRLIVTNNGNRPISLRDARILFLTAGGDKIPAIKLHPKASNKEIEEDFDTFEYGALVVEPHTTRAGFLFYDVSQLDHPLQGAKLHLHKLRDADGNELFYFEIPFDKYLKSKGSQMN